MKTNKNPWEIKNKYSNTYHKCILVLLIRAIRDNNVTKINKVMFMLRFFMPRVGRSSSGIGNALSMIPFAPTAMLATVLPSGSMTVVIPLPATRTIDSPSSTARIRARARCWYGPSLKPNHASLVTFNSHSGRSCQSLTLSGKITS